MMRPVGIFVGIEKEAVRAVGDVIMDIIGCQEAENTTKQEALRTLASLAHVGPANICSNLINVHGNFDRREVTENEPEEKVE